MSDPNATKRLAAEGRAACATLEDAAKKLLAWADTGAEVSGHQLVMLNPTELKSLAHQLAHQGGRLDMAVSMAHVRRKK